MIFSFCLNKSDLLIVCGMTLLYRVIDLKQDGKLMRDDQKLINAAIKIVERSKASGSWDFKRIAGRLITLDEPVTCSLRQSSSRETSARASRSPTSTQSRKNLPYISGRRPDAAASESDLLQQQERIRRMTMPNLEEQRPAVYRSVSRQSFESLPTENSWHQQDQRTQATNGQQVHPNLDYLSLGNTPSQSRQSSPPRNRMYPPSIPQHRHSMGNSALASKAPTTASVANSADWEVLLGTMDNGYNNVYDAIYGGPGFINEASVPAHHQQQHHHHNGNDWSPDSWDLSNFSIGEFAGVNTAGSSTSATGPAAPQSVLSLSDESLSSGEDVAPSELGLSMGSVPDYQANILPTGNDGFILGGLDEFPL